MATEYKLSYTASEIDKKLGQIDNLAAKDEIPTKTSQLTNDSGFITSYTETDPTVPDWAKAKEKPTYTADEVGALPDSTEIPSRLSDLSEDTTHRLVTDTEKTTWNTKSNFSGSYNDLTDKPIIPSMAGLASTTYVDEAVKNKVDKDGNKVLSTNDYTTAEKNKLAGIASGAEVNVNADWNATSGDAQILNKPTLGAMATKNSVAKSDLVSEVQTSLGKANTALQPIDISDWAKQTTKPEYGADEIILDTTDWESSEPSDAPRLKLDDFLEALRKEINIEHMIFRTHIGTESNPHGVTKTQVGLGNVNNTSDANKPVSTKQATAIADAKKAGTDALANLDVHTNNFSNPHFVTKSQLGLDYVENVRQYSVNNPPILAQPTPPDDPNALWVDTSDINDDGFQEAVKTAVAQAKGEIVQEVIAALPIYTGEVL